MFNSCKNCAFYDADAHHEQGKGICRKNPPNYGAWWAIVGERDWCGEMNSYNEIADFREREMNRANSPTP